MNSFYAYTKLPDTLAAYAKALYGDPMRFPKDSPEECALYIAIRRWPQQVNPAEVIRKANTRIIVPNHRDKKPGQGYTYIPDDGRQTLCRTIDKTLTIDMWNGINELRFKGNSLEKAIDQWLIDRNMAQDMFQTIENRFRRLQRVIKSAL